MSNVDLDQAELKQKYTQILQLNGIEKEIREVVVVEPDLKGEHMASACDYVTVKFADNSEDLELFIKKYLNNALHTEFVKQMSIFEKESTFFNELLPDSRKFCQQKVGNADYMKFFPKSYFGDDSIIVLENLAPQGYFMLNKMDKQDFDQAKIVLGNLARFHGVFYAWIKELGAENFIAKYPYANKEAFYQESLKAVMAPMFDNNVGTCIQILESTKVDGYEEHVEWLKSLIDNGKLYEQLIEVIRVKDDDNIFTLNHGDCWNNNMMFLKNKETNEILDHLFVDMQIIRLGSPCLDIGYFLFTSVKQEVRNNRLTDLLRYYFDILKSTIEDLGSALNSSFDAFVEDYKSKCTMGFYIGLTFMAAIGAMKDIDMEKAGTDMAQMQEYFNNVIKEWFEKNSDQAVSISNDIVESIKEYKKLSGI